MQSNLIINNVLDFGAVGDGSDDDGAAIAAALAAAASNGGDVVFPSGLYRYATTPNFAVDNIRILGLGEVVLEHTGTGIAFDMDGSVGIGGKKWNIGVENIHVRGNPNTTIGFRFRALGHCTFRKLRVLKTKGINGVGYKLEWTVANIYESLVCTSGENNVGSTLPQFGIVIDAFGNNSQDNTFINPIIEGLTLGNAVGLHIVNGSRNWFIGGTIEHNDKQVEIDDICVGNTFIGAYFEDAQLGVHVTDHGKWTQWVNCRADGANNAEFHVESDAVHTVFLGGEIVNLVLKSGAQNVCLTGTTVTALTDSATRTVRLGVYDQDASVHVANKLSSALTFDPDATFDVGGSATTVRPRDVHASRNINAGTEFRQSNTRVVGARVTGWGAPTGTATRSTFATASVTLPQLAQRVKALIDDLTAHGLIGP